MELEGVPILIVASLPEPVDVIVNFADAFVIPKSLVKVPRLVMFPCAPVDKVAAKVPVTVAPAADVANFRALS